MEKEFIPYEQALALKELGFDEECFCGYNKDKRFIQLKNNITANYNNPHSYDTLSGFNNNKYTTVSAPLYQQAFRWFRNKHKHLKFFIKEGFREGLYEYEMKDVLGVSGFKTNEEAELECLKKLIEIIKNKKKL
jgi:hypothetical protein